MNESDPDDGDVKEKLQRLHGSRRRADRASDERKRGTYRATDVEERRPEADERNRAAEEAEDGRTDGAEGREERGGFENGEGSTDRRGAPSGAGGDRGGEPVDPDGRTTTGDREPAGPPLAARQTGRGPIGRVNVERSAPIRHGDRRLRPGPCTSGLDALRGGVTEREGVVPGRVGFLDTETTGLSSSDFAFCSGLAVWRKGVLEIEQLVMRGRDEEAALLEATAAAIAELDVLCTYNGGSFDLPLLERRAEARDVDFPSGVEHLDLLPVARRRCPALADHRLETLEASRVGLKRTDDLPGSSIPARWERFLDSGCTDELQPVLEHNRLDLLSLAALAVPLSETEPGAHPAHTENDQSEDGDGAAENADREVARQLARAERARRDSGPSGRRGAGGTDEAGAADDLAHEPAVKSSEAAGIESADGRDVQHLVEQLRRRARESLDNGNPDRAISRLRQIVAIQPRHPFALRALVDWHREHGDDRLADHYEERLERVAPF